MTRLGVLQTQTGIDPEDNAIGLVAGIGELAKQGAEIVFTPEMSGLLDRDRNRAATRITSEDNDIVLAAVRRAAAAHRIWVQLGSLALRPVGSDRLVNRAFLINPDGAITARYDKIHLFDVDLPNGDRYRESATYAPGDRAVVAASPWGGIGLTVCYDLRFPLLYNDLARAGAQMIAIPAAFTCPTGEAHWHVLLRARAIETQTFVVAAAQCGDHADGRATFGRSLVINPWGTILLDMGDAPGQAVVDIDLTDVATNRSRIPTSVARRTFSPATLTPALPESTERDCAPVAQPDRATVS